VGFAFAFRSICCAERGPQPPFPTNPAPPPGLNLGVIVQYAFYVGWILLGVGAILWCTKFSRRVAWGLGWKQQLSTSCSPQRYF